MHNSDFTTTVDINSFPFDETIIKPNSGVSPEISSDISIDQLDFGFAINNTAQIIDNTKTAVGTNEEKSPAIKRNIRDILGELLNYLTNDVFHRKHELLQLTASRREKVLHDLDQIASNSTYSDKNITQEQFETLIYSDDPETEKVLSIFSHRVAYSTLLKFILVKYWVDLGLLNEKNVKYSDLNWTISKILSSVTQNLVADKHSWLFIKQNSYSWYRTPQELIEVIIQRLQPFSLRDSSCDIINFIYEHYLKNISNNPYFNLTPTPLVKFTWDKILNNENHATSFFRKLGMHFQTKLVFDPAMGSGNFLSEIAQRIKREINAKGDVKAKDQLLSAAITGGLYGCDIDPFSYIFAEIKLLWILSPTFNNKKDFPSASSLTLSIIHQNSLKLHGEDQLEFDQSKKPPKLESDFKFNLLPLEGHLKNVYSKIKNSARFDFVVCCPPESREQAEQLIIKETSAHLPYWQQFYCGNMDYSSWFFILGLSKLREGGKLGFVTNSYWPTSEGGTKLRKYILENAKIIEIIDLNTYILPNEHNPIPRYITILERCSSKENRDQNKIKITRVTSSGKNIPLTDLLNRLLQAGKTITSHGQVIETDLFQIFFSAIPQSDLDQNPWTIIQESGFSGVLHQIAKTKVTLGTLAFLARKEGAEEAEEIGTENGTTHTSICQEFLFSPETARVNNFHLQGDLGKISARDIVICKKPNTKESIHYIQAILNSSLATFWYQHNGNQRNSKFVYTVNTLKLMPIRTIKFDDKEDEILRERKSRFEQAAKRKDFKFLEASLKLEIDHGNEELVHDAIVFITNEIGEIRKKATKYKPFILKNAKGADTISNIAIFPIFPKNRLALLREHTAIQMEVCGETNIQTFCLAGVSRESGIKYESEHLLLISNDSGTLKIYAPGDLLDLLEGFLKERINEFFEEFTSGIFLPQDLHLWEAQKHEILNAYKSQEEHEENFLALLDQLIFKLYGFNPSSQDPSHQQFSLDAVNLMRGCKTGRIQGNDFDT
ncbi:MAG: hypothetical protein A3F16_04845 [Deltaproteobacteria bacterium RIFCSPHIGHO2_12_FULL_43_9]|nr:MAG: hypothetical protein A3F16_04845 [Deltaproteobacteria bacterium RIFCSPHIGHO2_12_FULL_43_9]